MGLDEHGQPLEPGTVIKTTGATDSSSGATNSTTNSATTSSAMLEKEAQRPPESPMGEGRTEGFMDAELLGDLSDSEPVRPLSFDLPFDLSSA
jgi:hypothetical protein